MTKILWIRKLSCGHERPTNIAFINGIYNKPKVGSKAYCRECFEEVKIIGVKKAKEEDVKELKKIEELVDKWKIK